MSHATVTIDLRNSKICPKITLVKLTWNSRRKDTIKLYYHLKRQTKLKKITMWITSNAGNGMLITQDKIIGLNVTSYFEDVQTITKYLELQLQKLSEMLNLEKPCYVADPADSSSDFFT